MSNTDRLSNAAEDAKGKIKETFGKATDDEQLEAEGKTDQAKAGLKDKVEDVKDKVAEKYNDLTDRHKDDA
ncbi:MULTISPECIES: CsbD family protein [Demequina]|uniref:CsbD family protein n=1 Tax=Demequina litorisediminis TaxID=1849022 RepID=A0ABQ6I8H8_9MICO|nr:CsbD family protein [Demequina litorisediminis]GMA34133.1 CsbD family protein [Demequina litorisediminis]